LIADRSRKHVQSFSQTMFGEEINKGDRGVDGRCVAYGEEKYTQSFGGEI